MCKEYCLIPVKCLVKIATLDIALYQLQEMTDDKFENIINKWILINEGNAFVVAKQKDITIHYKNKDETIVCNSTNDGIRLTLSRMTDDYELVESDQLI